MARAIRESVGALLVLVALATLFWAATELRGHDYVASILLVVTGISLVWAGVEVLRPSLGE